APARGARRAWNTRAVELGLYTFGEVIGDGDRVPTAATRIADLITTARLADEAGLAVFGVGEHNRLDLPLSSPMIVLAAIAPVTHQIRLTTAATVLGALDPVRVFEDLATLDVIASGRAELMVGRGGFVDAFALFGKDLADYDALFEEHLDLLARLAASPRADWRGRLRAPLVDAEIAPRPVQARIPTWAAVASPASAGRAGAHGLGLVLPGNGDHRRLHSLVELYRTESAIAGHPPGARRIAIAGHGVLDRDGDAARAELARRLAIEQAHFGALTGASGALLVGSPSEAIDQLHALYEDLGVERVLLRIDLGGASHATIARTIELLGTVVAPAVRELGGHAGPGRALS
ncbi:MAG: LLM class flavin-dependent oxidoreductase, partial [Deltaproteobacteria bacterium]|nr:LLM class flavin-dependent oxidoreductase [Deltaproteobacteria bacterium]